MKRNFSVVAIVFMGLLLGSCSSSKDQVAPDPIVVKEKPVEKPILSVTVKDYPDAKVVIDHENKKISFDFETPASLTKLSLDFVMDGKAKISKPATSYNLTTDYTLKLDNNTNEQSYTLVAKAKSLALRSWTVVDYFGDLPSYIRVYKSISVQGKSTIAYAAVVDLTYMKSFNVLGEASGVKTPSDFYAQIPAASKPTVLINSGYFTYSAAQGNYGVSLLVRNGETIRHNTTDVTRQDSKYYITRSAIGIDKEGGVGINWVYTNGISSPTYAYPLAAANVEGAQPLPKPTLTYPTGGRTWALETASGAGPIAAKYGKTVPFAQMQYEMLSGDGNALRPRSAVGITSENKLIFFVNQGDGFEGVTGLNWEDVGKELVSMGCYDVMHLDGGGSSCMLINGIPLIKGGDKSTVSVPNDGTKQRAVATVISIK